MHIEKVIAPRGCVNGACPTLHLTNEGQVIIQGSRLPPEVRAEVPTPPQEDVVIMPQTVFEDLLRRYLAGKRGS
jgi:hypothetical protein